MGIGSGQSLSCPHSDHNGSRDLPKHTGGPPGEAEFSCGSWAGAKTLTA